MHEASNVGNMAPVTAITGHSLQFRAFLIALAVGFMLALIASSGCQSMPLTGRRQLVLIPESQEVGLGAQAYEQVLADEPMSENQRLVEVVNRVGQRIAAVAGKPQYDWEFRVIAKDVMNAFALPGGKVAVYEGIIPVCQDEAGLAVVMSHEVAHALARHGAERMSQETVASGVGGILDAVSQKNADPATAGKIMQVYGAASKYGVILPYSRKHESEADAIGLILMAKAGYDPSAAPEFWERFSRQSGSKPPEWLSTHPADARRAAALRELLPEAMNYYQSAAQQLGLGDALPPIARRESTPALASGTPGRSHVSSLADGSPMESAGPSWALPPSASSSGQESFRLPIGVDMTSSSGNEVHLPEEPIDDGWRKTEVKTLRN